MLAAEALVAATSLWPKYAPTRTDLLSAQGIVARWNRVVKKFITGEQGQFEWSEPLPADDLHNKLIEPLTVDQIVELTGWLGEDPLFGLDYAATIRRGRDYLLSLWPDLPATSDYADSFDLSSDDLDAVWSVFRVLDDADTLVDELLAWSITEAQAKGFRTVYPELSALIDESLDMAMADAIAKGKPPRWEVADVVKMWRGIPLDQPIQIKTPADGEKQAAPNPSTIDFKALSAPSEKGK